LFPGKFKNLPQASFGDLRRLAVITHFRGVVVPECAYTIAVF